VSDLVCDLLVIGSGAAGLCAAVTAASLGLQVIVVEKESWLGGASAWSAGRIRVPPPGAVPAGEADAALVERYLDQAPRMLDFCKLGTAVRIVHGARGSGSSSGPGAGTGADAGAAPPGRLAAVAPFNGRRLGAGIARLRPPLREVAPFGMGIAAGEDLQRFMTATRSFAAFRHAAGRLARHARDRLRRGRGMHLVDGNALVAALAWTAAELRVRFLIEAPAIRLLRANWRISGAEVVHRGERIEIPARRGVLLATGGFPHKPERIAALLPDAPEGASRWPLTPPGNTGDGLRLGEAAGGRVRSGLADAVAWAPVSLLPRRDASVAPIPHLADRAGPGLIAVRRDGRPFAGAAVPGHAMIRALFAATPPGEPVEGWLIADDACFRGHGLGAVWPASMRRGRHLRSGYLRRGASPAELAAACGIDPAGLAETLAGLPPPFYAVRIVPGILGTLAGLVTDADARVTGRDGKPVPGLYAAGSDMADIFGGHEPSAGLLLGAAMTFGFIAAHHAARVPLDSDARPAPWRL
jgi:succinate dehydrogenase/fumarate reductase flavoprotein subunit